MNDNKTLKSKNNLTNINDNKLNNILDYRNKGNEYNKTTVTMFRIYKSYTRLY